ncbi:MAG: helix-turn-helix domain-containing protein [Treponema sp.]|jgi:transcriptional regulator with XRE-family HTH domain|nr:helix-turn-helix domain-containing protein [Treponema sp.]
MGFRENLKEELSFTGMYVKELAGLSGLKKQTIDSYLNVHGCMPSAEAAVAIAQALGVSVEYLVTGEEAKQKTVQYHKEVKQTTAQYPIEAKIAAEIIAQMEAKNRKMAVAIVKSMKKREDEEKKRK